MSNTTVRILISLIAIPLILGAVYAGGHILFALLLILQTLCFYELLKMFREKEFKPDMFPAIVLSIITMVSYVYLRHDFIYAFIPAILIIALMEFISVKKSKLKNTGLVLFGLAYITFPFTLLNALGSNYEYVYLLLMLIWADDSFAYFGGKYFGKHKFSQISPNKTIEGLISGFIFTVITGIVFHLFSEKVTLADGIITGTFAGIFAPAGDLFESFLKRYTGVKDSSRIIPGHGGLLDRFDSLIFCTPFIYIYFNYLKFFVN